MNLATLQPHLADPARHAEKLSRGAFTRFRHIRYLSNLIADDVATGETRRIVSTPPQVGKSTLFSQALPTWLLDIDPKRRILCVSYGSDLATRNSRAVSATLSEPENRDLLRVRLGKCTEELIETTAGGCLKAVGIGGGITGFGFTDVIFDDPYRDPEQAFSPAYRAKIEEIYQAVIMTRLAKGANVWGIQTRWHDEDFGGMRAKDPAWKVTRLPAFAEEGDELGRAPGEVLCPELHTEEEYRALRDGKFGDGIGAMLPALFAALYQGKPLREGSGLFSRSWVRILDLPPALYSARVRYWDLAASKTRAGRAKSLDRDYAVGTLGMRTREERYVIEHVERLRGTAQDVDQAILRCAERDGHRVPIRIEKEPGSSGELYAAYLTRRLAGWSVTFVPSTGDKETRFRPFASQCQAGNVEIVRAAWNDPWFAELEVAFAGAPHDDQADSASGAFAALCGGNPWPWLSPGPRGIVSAAMSASSSPPPSPFDSPEERERAPARPVPRPAVATSEDDADTGPRLADIRRARSGAFRGGFARELAEGGL